MRRPTAGRAVPARILLALILGQAPVVFAVSSQSTAVLSPDGGVVLLTKDAENVDEPGHWAAVVDSEGELMFERGASPFAQHVNGSSPTGSIKLGTPAVPVDVIFDTGSEKLVVKTWDTVKRELDVIDGSASSQVVPTKHLYDHNASNTYVPEFINVKGAKMRKRGFVAYGSGTAFTDEGKDTLRVAGRVVRNFTVAEITSDSLAVMHSRRGVSGVLGLQHMKNNTMGKSFFTLCREAGTLTAFGYCRGKKNDGRFIWGDESTEGTKLPVLGQIHWAVSLADVTVGAPKVDKSKAGHMKVDNTESVLHRKSRMSTKDDGFVDAYVTAKYAADSSLIQKNATGTNNLTRICPEGKCVTVIDTGSNIIAGPIAALRQISKQLGVKHDCSNMKELPDMQMAIGGFSVTLPSTSYIMKLKLPPLIPIIKPGRSRHMTSYLEDQDGEHLTLENSTEASLTEEQLVDHLHQHLHTNYGLDLRAILDGVPVKSLLSGTTMCMPAFVPLDKQTTSGPLWVLGTPLFDGYYVRWSWPQDEKSPSIFIKELKEADTCRADSEKKDGKGPPNIDRLMRAEARPIGLPLETSPEPTAGPPEWEAGEIRFPRWATQLDNL